MNKTEIMAALTAEGIEFDPAMTVAQLTDLAGANSVSLVKPKPSAPKLVTVSAVGPLAEDGVVHAAGDVFQTTPERAEALGENVKPASAPEA